jgi:hypothetical protein
MMRHTLLGIAAALAVAALLPLATTEVRAQQSEGSGQTEADRGESQEPDSSTDRQSDTQSESAQTDQTEESSAQPSPGSDAEQRDSRSDAESSTDTSQAQREADDRSTADAERDAGTARNQDRGEASDSGPATIPPPDAGGQATDRPTQDDQDASAPVDRRDGGRRMDRRDARDFDRERTDDRSRGRDGRRDRRDRGRDRDFNLGISFSVGVSGRGLVIDTIDQTSVFVDSGLRRGDVIISVFGRPVRSEVEFVTLVRSRPGVEIPVIVLRDGREETIYLTYEEEVLEPEPPVAYDDQPMTGGPGFLGVLFDIQAPNAAVIRSVLPDSPAAQAGLQAGDEIVALNGEDVSSYPQAIEIIATMRAGEPLSIAFMRPAEHQTEALLAPRPASGVRTANRPIDRGPIAAPPEAFDQPREVGPGPASPPPENRGRILNQPNRGRPLLAPLRGGR